LASILWIAELGAVMFGRFLEIGIATRDIAASFTFYDRLGFSQLTTSDAWPHRYGVLSDERLYLGLHEREMPSPSVTFVLPDLALAMPRLRSQQLEPELALLGEDSLNQVVLRDPEGHGTTLLEARTYSPAPQDSPKQSLCGYFSHLSLPQTDFDAARKFWERAGFVALGEEELPFPHLPLTSDHLDLAFHQRRTFDAPLLVFECADVTAAIARLQELELPLAKDLPRGLDRKRNCLIESPEGTALLIVPSR
jgi:catechol 2,3-dioxygenase-like lactoylglutathione lyase family enzyme